MNESELSRLLSTLTGRPVIIEHRGKFGWFVVERGQTLFGFQTRTRLVKYIAKVKDNGGMLHTPSASETYR